MSASWLSSARQQLRYRYSVLYVRFMQGLARVRYPWLFGDRTDTEKQESKTGFLRHGFLLSLALSQGGLIISSENLNAAYSEDELDYLDDKLAEWVLDETGVDFVAWMLSGHDHLGVLHHLKDEE
jgi:hypothetical protein